MDFFVNQFETSRAIYPVHVIIVPRPVLYAQSRINVYEMDCVI
jgi:hypothetical protein